MANPSIAPTRRVVCAANRFPGGVLVLGARHFDGVMRQTIKLLSLTPGSEEQGFIDQAGQFLTRQEAWKVAEAAGQIQRRVGGDTSQGGSLYSENLY